MPDTAKGTIIITGTSRGIGYHLALGFLDLGNKVIGISRHETKIDQPGFRSVIADLADLSQVQALSSIISSEPIVGLINNAGMHGPIGPFAENSLDQWVHTFQINLFGAAALTQLCIPSLRQHQGFVIFFSGGGSAFPRPNFSAYGVSKCGVIRLAEVLAHELAPEVMVYCVAPGPNKTELLEEAMRNGEVVPPGDMVDFGYPERLCVFLAQNRDPRYSGKFIHVRDNYPDWRDLQFEPDAYTLRRIKPT